LLDYLKSDLALSMNDTEIDVESFKAAANICDEQVQVLPVSPVTNENRYECNGVLSTSESPDSNIGKLLSSMGGLIAYSGGKIVLYAAGYRIPTVTLTEKHFAGGMSVQTRTSARDRVNAVKGVYVSEANQWQVSDFPSIAPSAYYTADNSVRYWRDVVLPFTTSSSCAQRLAVIELRRAREEITFTARFRLEAMQVRAGDTVMITNAKLGWSAKVFEVMEWHFTTEGNPPNIGVEMTMRETASTVYDWTVADEVAVPDSPNTTLPNPYDLSAPTNLTLTANGTTQLIQADGTALPRILVAWTAPAEAFIQSGGVVAIEYKESTSATYLTWSRVGGDQTRDYISSDVKIGLTYDVRIFGESYFNVSTSYLTAQTGVAKDTTAPVTPTGLTAVVGTGRAVSLDWNDNTEPDFSEYGIYRLTSPVTASALKIAEVRASRFVDTDVDIGTTYYYWLNAYDTVENVSGFTNYVQATPSVITAGPIDPTPPDQPAAPTLISTTVYLSSDGGSFARVSLTAPPLPARAVALDVLYRRTGASDYIVGNQIASSVSYAVSIDDLSVGVAYEFAARGISFSGAISQLSTALSQSAPSNTTLPDAPTAVTYIAGNSSSFERPAEMIGGIVAFSVRVNWTPPTTKSVLSYESVYTVDDTDAAANYNYSLGIFFRSSIPEEIFSDLATPIGFIRVRSVDRSGQKSAWAGGGVNLTTPTMLWGIPGPTLMRQAASSVNITGGTVAGITDIALADGGTGASTAANARINLLPAYAGNGLKTLALNSGATDVEWSAAGTGTVTSVAGAGTVNGLTLTGTVTASGSLTLGGTLANVDLTTSVTGTLPIANGGTAATTASGARDALLPDYSGNVGKVLAVNSGATDVEWSAAGTGTVTSVDLDGGTTGLTFSGSPITSSGTITVAGTLALANGGTGATTDSGARTALGLGTAATANLNALGAITVDKISFTGGDPVTTIDETWGITLNGDATHPVRVVGAALVMGSFDAGGSLTAGRIFLAEDRSLYTSGTDLLFNNGSVTISITAAPVVPVVTTVILGYPLCSTYGGTDGNFLRQISYNSVTYLCFGE
jgi:hypothetical protein